MSENKNGESKDLVYYGGGGVVDYWKNKQKLRSMFMKRYDLNEEHFQLFCAFGYSLEANPWAGEIIPILFNRGQQHEKLSFILTRDFRGRIAQQQEDYVTHSVFDVCENDSFKMDAKSGIPDHEWDETLDRGSLKGAYCLVWKKGVDRPVYKYVKYSQFRKSGKGGEVWEKHPDLMIQKIAENHGLKMAYYNRFSNTYDAAEVRHERGIVIDIIDENEQKQISTPPKKKKGKDEKFGGKVTDDMRLELNEKMKAHLGGDEEVEQFLMKRTGGRISSTSGISEIEYWGIASAFDEELKEKGK